ncbi:hypothetical protein AMECASPLE_020395 [Ameca splendens]|uniref:Uncharacterized protein n=1 Tax=Ameca splendens TaxID=208324 RepID=A0ABV0YQ70_9TELE
MNIRTTKLVGKPTFHQAGLCSSFGEIAREEACGLRDEEEEKRVVGKNQTVEDWLPTEEQRTEELSIKTREILGV